MSITTSMKYGFEINELALMPCPSLEPLNEENIPSIITDKSRVVFQAAIPSLSVSRKKRRLRKKFQ